MMRQHRHPFGILFRHCLVVFFLLFSWAHAQQDDVCVLVSDVDSNNTEEVAAKCLPLRILTEPTPTTDVGVFCVEQSSPDWQVTFTVPPHYEILDVAFHITRNVSDVPSTGGDSFGRPAPNRFEFQEIPDSPTPNVSMTIPSTTMGDLTCGTTTDHVNYMVAHATVSKTNAEEEAREMEVYAHEGILFQFVDVVYDVSQYFSYVQLDCRCDELATNLTTSEATNNQTRGNNFTVFATNETDTQATNNLMTLPNNTTTTPIVNIKNTTLPPTNNLPLETLGPAKGLAGKDLVVGMSFLVITETSASTKTLPHEQIQHGFGDFCRNILHEMRVDPVPSVGLVTSSSETNGRRKLWVQYDNDTIHVYQFLVSTYCDADDAKSVIASKQQQKVYAPPPSHSQCHRAYARFGVRIVDENPTEVCQRLRNGTLLGYQRGMLQQAMEEAYPGTTLQLLPGDFEYCVPLDDFVVPNHTEPVEHWTDAGDPLANLTTITTTKPQEEFPWLLLIIVGSVGLATLMSVVALRFYLWRRQKQGREEPKLSNAAPPEVSALMG
jgi:hypothetical protein